MYFEDMTPYRNTRNEIVPNVFCVGWLDSAHEFPRGHVSGNVLTCLAALCFQLVNQARGFKRSPFLPRDSDYPTVQQGGKSMRLGSAELWVRGEGERVYASPNLVYQYVRGCGYLPPEEYLNAVVSERNLEGV